MAVGMERRPGTRGVESGPIAICNALRRQVFQCACVFSLGTEWTWKPLIVRRFGQGRLRVDRGYILATLEQILQLK